MLQTLPNASNLATFSRILAFRLSFVDDLRVLDEVKFDFTKVYPMKWQNKMVKLKKLSQIGPNASNIAKLSRVLDLRQSASNLATFLKSVFGKV